MKRALGSSPLTRGRRPRPRHQLRRLRLIPAHAGSTVGEDTDRQNRWAHPRSRGVDPQGPAHCALCRGSSPLTRGRRTATMGGTSTLTAHPRSRGVDCHGFLMSTAPARLIPAHAGSTAVINALMADSAAHPRSRGVDVTNPFNPATRGGSSPLTRGRLIGHLRNARSIRLIPAHAGSTASTVASPCPPTAHPRSRGVDARPSLRGTVRCGSSPLTRGRPLENAGTSSKPVSVWAVFLYC